MQERRTLVGAALMCRFLAEATGARDGHRR
jgi:hypothetical protein